VGFKDFPWLLRNIFVMKKIIFFSIAIAVVVAAVIFLLYKEKRIHADRIILVTIDTLRADHLGCYGYPRLTSPFIDRLAAGGIRFEKAFAASSTTSPSHATIFTSLYPMQHNVLKNGQKLDTSFFTMAEYMGAMGYDTAAFVSTDTHFKCGDMDQGFHTFDEPQSPKAPPYRRADDTVDRALKWLSKKGPDDRFFLWIHLFDPHAPYNPPPPFLSRFKRAPRQEKLSFVRFLLHSHHVDFGFYGRNVGKMLAIMDAYDGEILFADKELERLHNQLGVSGLDDHMLWIITSDHGEGLGNHRWLGHGKHIYNEQIHVPLIFRFSSAELEARSVDRIVEHVDIFPTLVELTGGTLEDQNTPVRGRSLMPSIKGDVSGLPDKVAFAQRRDFDHKNRPKIIIPERTNYEEGEKYALQDVNYKYIYRTQGEDELYFVAADPYEIQNLVGEDKALADRWKYETVETIRHLTPEKKDAPKYVDQETLDKLRSLGYIK
jgi:arylsulfatase A-like enzyme